MSTKRFNEKDSIATLNGTSRMRVKRTISDFSLSQNSQLQELGFQVGDYLCTYFENGEEKERYFKDYEQTFIEIN